MKIIKEKNKFNSYKIEGLSSGKLLAINAALEAQEKNGTISPVGQDVLAVLNQERKNFIHG